jgi:SsrA-binding protein
MSGASEKEAPGLKIIATNRRARHDFHILEKFEAGIELRGCEVKSIRAGHVSLAEAYAKLENGEIVLHSLHVQPYEHSRAEGYDPVRPKRLLLHRSEIHRLLGQITAGGKTLIPLRLHLRKGFVKVELALARGKQASDKRETIRRRTAEREAARAISDRVKRG